MGYRAPKKGAPQNGWRLEKRLFHRGPMAKKAVRKSALRASSISWGTPQSAVKINVRRVGRNAESYCAPTRCEWNRRPDNENPEHQKLFHRGQKSVSREEESLGNEKCGAKRALKALRHEKAFRPGQRPNTMRSAPHHVVEDQCRETDHKEGFPQKLASG